MKKLMIAIAILLIVNSNNFAQTTISKSFELRYFTPDSKADGETDFKGETEYFDTDQRVDYLKTYEQYARQYFGNPDWNKLVVTNDEAKAKAAKIKPQPLPEVRNRILLQEWKCLGFKNGQHEERLLEIGKWNSHKNVLVKNESLHFENKTEFSISIPEQSWRSLFKLSVFVPEGGIFEWNIGNAIRVTQKDLPKNQWTLISIDYDLENAKYNLSVDDHKIVDFEPIDKAEAVNELTFIGSRNVQIDNIHCVQYTKGIFTEDKNSRDIPYLINTFLFENFKEKPKIKSWQSLDYNDKLWETQKIPFPHGGERFKDESLYMRKIIVVPDFKVA
ncbi:MAG: hypothetical protein KAQ79_10915, partial [Cyclobacteriaceae bacterium]|nr:hypothetical protein [Cyclobacteriaceae bacterium]